MTNCTFSGNTAVLAGGGMRNGGRGGIPTVTNCILWGDSPDEIASSPSAVTLTYSDVQGGWPGTGNIDADPMFVDPDNGDFRLSPGSHCIDAGDNTAFDPSDCGDCDQPSPVPGCSDPTCEEQVCGLYPFCCRGPWDSFCVDAAGWACQCFPIPDIATDLDGNPRFVDDPDTVDTGFGDPPIVDMGAYEFQSIPCPWDCGGDNDGNVGIVDFLELLAQWGGPGTCDIDGAGVRITDFLLLLSQWGPCP